MWFYVVKSGEKWFYVVQSMYYLKDNIYPYFDISVFYFSVISRYIDLKFIQDTYRVVINSPNKFDRHMSKVKVTATVHCFLKVQSYHKN